MNRSQGSTLPGPLPISHIAIIGAGVMGIGVAQCFATHGFFVTLVESDTNTRENALTQIKQQLRAYKLTHPELIPKPIKEILSQIQLREDLAVLSEADVIIENINESIQLKSRLYGDINEQVQPNAIIVANTSAIPIYKLSRQLSRPENMLGIHFMNPPLLKNTVELIISPKTSEHTATTITSLLQGINKCSIQVADRPGFVSNRILMLTINEAIQTLEDGVSNAQDIDDVFKECFGHAMGPLATADLIGLDVIRDTLLVLLTEYRNEKYRPADSLEEMIKLRKLGRKTGEGFFKY